MPQTGRPFARRAGREAARHRRGARPPRRGVVTLGQASDDGPSEALTKGQAVDAVTADKGYDADRRRSDQRQGSRAVGGAASDPAALPPRHPPARLRRGAPPPALPGRVLLQQAHAGPARRHALRSEAPARTTARELPRHGPDRLHPHLDRARRRAVGYKAHHQLSHHDRHWHGPEQTVGAIHTHDLFEPDVGGLNDAPPL